LLFYHPGDALVHEFHTFNLMWSQNFGKFRIDDHRNFRAVAFHDFDSQDFCKTLVDQWSINLRWLWFVDLFCFLDGPRLLINGWVVEHNSKLSAGIMKRFGDEDCSLPESKGRRRSVWIVCA